MKIGIHDDCRSCAAPIALCRVRGGKWFPFELAMVELTTDTVEAYLPIRQQGGAVALVPVDEISQHRLDGVRWCAQRHRCAPYLRSKAAAYQGWLAKRERVDSLGDAADALARDQAPTRRGGVMARPLPPPTTADRANIADLYRSGHSTWCVARQVGRSQPTVRYHLRAMAVQMRPRLPRGQFAPPCCPATSRADHPARLASGETT
jgi:hypothetical protein